VLFDVDGTLVDTNYLHVLAWSRALRDNGEWAPMNAIHRLVGMGGDQLVPRLLGHKDDAVEQARTRHYKDLIEEARVIPGAADLLQRVHDAGLKVVLATSSPADELKQLRQLIDADDVIDAQTTADDVGPTKPEPDVFLAAVRTGGVDPQGALVVGDSVWDIRAARAAGIGCVAVESGGFSQHELSEAGALQVYRDVRELCDQFNSSPLALLGIAN
jgi:HAD superfamily hydrolase (TIGR01509 family)